MAMQHTEATVKVYYTRDYSRFRIIEGNRELDGPKISRIKDEINGGLDLLRYCPIVCIEEDDVLKIIDGQNRFFVCKNLKSFVWYVIVSSDLTLTEIAKLNSNSSNWKNNDYIHCFVTKGNDDYVYLRQFLEINNLPFSISMRLLGSGRIKNSGLEGNILHDFKKGTFKCTYKEKAEEFVQSLELFSFLPFYKSGKFIEAVFTIWEKAKVPVSDLAQKVKDLPKKMLPELSVSDYLEELETIFSYGQHQRIGIY